MEPFSSVGPEHTHYCNRVILIVHDIVHRAHVWSDNGHCYLSRLARERRREIVFVHTSARGLWARKSTVLLLGIWSGRATIGIMIYDDRNVVSTQLSCLDSADEPRIFSYNLRLFRFTPRVYLRNPQNPQNYAITPPPSGKPVNCCRSIIPIYANETAFCFFFRFFCFFVDVGTRVR